MKIASLERWDQINTEWFAKYIKHSCNLESSPTVLPMLFVFKCSFNNSCGDTVTFDGSGWNPLQWHWKMPKKRIQYLFRPLTSKQTIQDEGKWKGNFWWARLLKKGNTLWMTVLQVYQFLNTTTRKMDYTSKVRGLEQSAKFHTYALSICLSSYPVKF